MKDFCNPSRKRVLQAKVRWAMTYAIRDKFEKFDRVLKKTLAILEEIGFTYIPKHFTFKDDNDTEFEMNELASPSFLHKYKQISTENVKSLMRYINHLQQNRLAIIQYGEKTGDIKSIMDRLETACQRRVEFIDHHGNLMGELVGKYQSDVEQNAVYFISTDPYDIFTKSTGRSWSPHNCERIDGESNRGIDSDISHNSAVVYILDTRIKGFKSAIARMNLRLCVVKENAKMPKHKYSIGWDINWYRGNDTHERFASDSNRKFDNMNLTARQALEELVAIIHEKGFNTEYEFCITPFAHEGYSDIENANRTAIAYQSKYSHHCDVCGVGTKKEFYERYGGKCKHCYDTHRE